MAQQEPLSGGAQSAPATSVLSSDGNEADTAAQSAEARLGFLAAFGAYGLWGLLTLYYAHLSHVPAVEVVANRVSWSLVILGLFFLVRGRWGEVWRAMRVRRIFLILLLTSVLISINWLTYIWAVTHGRATEASLGYFIMPLVNVAAGALLLSERLSRLQWLAIALVVVAIALQAILLGSLPVVSLIVALTFGTYGYLRKIVDVGANLGLLVELVLVAPFAIGYLVYQQASGQGHLSLADPTTTALLVFTGVVTYLPLMWFAAAAKRLRLTTLGIMQYMNPTIQFLLAVFVLGEAVSPIKLATFCLIWLSVALYSIDAWQKNRRKGIAGRARDARKGCAKSA